MFRLAKMPLRFLTDPRMTKLPMFLIAIFFVVQVVRCTPSTPLNSASWGGIRRPGVPGSLGAPYSACATLPDYAEWFQPSRKFDLGDCSKAIDIFYHDYVKDHNGIKYEFLPSGVRPIHGIPTQRIPLKVGYGR